MARKKTEQVDISKLASSLFERVYRIKERHSSISRQIDQKEYQIRQLLEGIRKDVMKLPPDDRALVVVFVINGLRRQAEEVLLNIHQEGDGQVEAKTGV